MFTHAEFDKIVKNFNKNNRNFLDSMAELIVRIDNNGRFLKFNGCSCVYLKEFSTALTDSIFIKEFSIQDSLEKLYFMYIDDQKIFLKENIILEDSILEIVEMHSGVQFLKTRKNITKENLLEHEDIHVLFSLVVYDDTLNKKIELIFSVPLKIF